MLQMTKGRVPKLIVCTGQSLGGALSTLCAAYMVRKYPTATVLTTNEGAPKVGTSKWVHAPRLFRTEAHNKRTIRILCVC